MALKYGFYDSVDGDRVYSAKDFTSIFNNLITDGVLPRTGNRNQFGATPASSGLGVTIDSGWAWFDSTYTFLTAPQTYALDAADAVLYRWDAVVIQTDNENRTNEIVVVKGTPAAENSAVKPTLTANQHPLCYAKVTPGLTKMVQGNIENRVGFSDCPWITGIVGSADLTQVFAQWQYDFDEWFDALQDALSGDVAGNLQRQITANANAISTINNTSLPLKADQTAVDDEIARLEGLIGTGGNNCRITIGSYVGNGDAGPNKPNSLTFDFTPDFLLISDPGNVYTPLGAVMFRNRTSAKSFPEAQNSSLGISWSGKKVSWWTTQSFYEAENQLNTEGSTYLYIALGH